MRRKKKALNIVLTTVIGALFACFSGKGSYFNWLIMTTVMYNVMTNNFIQTLGTFKISNKYAKKWKVFLSLTTMFVVYFIYRWLKYDGNIRKGVLRYIEYKESFRYPILLLPLILSLFNYFGVPVSITFLTISLFINNEIVKNMIIMASIDYVLAFIISFLFWNTLYTKFSKLLKKRDNYQLWKDIEYLSIGILWICWLNTCVSSFVIFLPPDLDIKNMILLLIIGSVIISIMTVFKPEDKMEYIIEEKTDVKNIMSSVFFNIMHSIVLLLLKLNSKVPVATGWIFIGLLGGRELGITVEKSTGFSDPRYKVCFIKVIRDLCRSIIGMFISLCCVKLIKMWGLYEV